MELLINGIVDISILDIIILIVQKFIYKEVNQILNLIKKKYISFNNRDNTSKKKNNRKFKL